MGPTLSSKVGERHRFDVHAQAYIARARIDSFSLIADMNYVSQNAPRICRAVFEIAMRNQWSLTADLALTLCKVLPCACLRGVSFPSCNCAGP